MADVAGAAGPLARQSGDSCGHDPDIHDQQNTCRVCLRLPADRWTVLYLIMCGDKCSIFILHMFCGILLVGDGGSVWDLSDENASKKVLRFARDFRPGCSA